MWRHVRKKKQSRIMACAKDSKYEPLYTKFQNEKTTYMQNNPKIWLMLKYYFCQTTLWLQSMTILGGACSVIGALNPHVSMFVVMNTSSMSTTSLLDRAFFHNTTFQLGFLMSLEMNTQVS
jgi:hypothetical protein